MRVEVRVQFDFDKDTATEVVVPNTDDSAESNVSNAKYIIDSENYAYSGYRGFQLAESTTAFGEEFNKIPTVLDGSSRCFPDQGYQGYVSRALSDENGDFYNWVELKLNISGKIPDYLFIRGDQVTGNYPTRYTVSSNLSTVFFTEVVSTRILNIVNLKPLKLPTAGELTLIVWFHSISKPYQSLKLTQLSLGYQGIYKENALKSVENSEQAFSSSMNLSPGLIAQYADIVIYDRLNLLHDLAKNEALKGRQDVHIYAIEDGGAKEDVGSYKADDWDVPSGSSDITITCTDDTDALDNTYCESGEVADRSVHELLALAFSFLNAAWQYIDIDTENYCKSIITPNSWYYNGTIKKLLDKICQLGQLNIYKYLGMYTVVRCY